MKLRGLERIILLSELKHLMAGQFRLDILAPDNIADDAQLTGGAFDLDSFDMLELAICVEEGFGIAIRSEEASRIAFSSIASLADFVHAHTQIRHARRLTEAECPAGGTASRIPADIFARRAVA